MAASRQYIRDIQAGNDQLIGPSAGKYFPAARKFLRTKGVRDDRTPMMFADAYSDVLSEIRKSRVPDWADFRNLLDNALVREIAKAKAADKGGVMPAEQPETVAHCADVLEPESRRLLFLRYAERKSYEEIAALVNFSNPVIAEFEVEKAYRQLEGIVRVRYNIAAGEKEVDKPRRLKIERFLAGQLTGSELEEFNLVKQQQPAFAQAVELHTWLQAGIGLACARHYRDLVLTGVRYRKSILPSPLKYILIFLLVTVSGSLLWFYLAPDTGNTKLDLSLLQLPEKGSEQKKVSKKKALPVVEETAQADTAASGELSQGPDTLAPAAGSEEEIVVRKDEMLISVDVPVTDLSDGNTGDKDALTHSAVEKLNPAAGLPEQTEAVPANIKTEFWVSPVNYHGYRFSNNTLVLFGIEEPDRVRLFRVKDFLYMGYQNSWYKLVPSDEFMAYQRIKDADVPLAIRSSR